MSRALSLSTLAEMRHMEELTTAEIAARIGRTERTVQRWIKNGKLPALPLANHRYAVNESDFSHLALPEHVSQEPVA